MINIKLKNLFLDIGIVIFIFLIDRISKTYILKIAELENILNLYVTQYFNIYLIWNKGIAFGLLSFNENYIYNLISLLIIIVNIIILIMIIKLDGFKKYSLILIFGGSLGNLFDRIYYSAVPDFIDFHINDFHWFIFNIADVFITLGVICLIYAEIFLDKKKNEKNT